MSMSPLHRRNWLNTNGHLQLQAQSNREIAIEKNTGEAFLDRPARIRAGTTGLTCSPLRSSTSTDTCESASFVFKFAGFAEGLDGTLDFFVIQAVSAGTAGVFARGALDALQKKIVNP